MGQLAKRVISQLNAAKSAADLEGVVWIASDRLAKFAFTNYHSGFPEIDREEVNDGERAQIQAALVEALGRNSDPKFVSQIINALGVTGDRSLKQTYVDYLTQYLKQLKWSNGVVYAALLALDGLDEEVYEKNPNGGSSQSVIDVDKNIRQAHRYLQKLGVIIPW
jgi:hypothetical protein